MLDRLHKRTPLHTKIMKDGRCCGNLVVLPTTLLGRDMSPNNQALAEVYEPYILAMLKLYDGHMTISELYQGDMYDIPIYLALHSLRNRGLVATPDPYEYETTHGNHHIYLIKNAIERIPPRRILSMAALRMQREVRRALEEYRRQVV